MKKRLFTTLFFAFILCTSALAGIIASGRCGLNVTYTLSDDGTLTIEGKGAMANYSDNSIYLNNHSPFYYYGAKIKNVTIKEGVTSIGSSAFQKCSSLSSVVIPSSLTSIGSSAFRGCI
ncbi:MAG: leucine-rich repeat domain-containing protein [Bacteroidaceae bacterium]|nr:leucine-rich repeat domain-containing protein [Bacteroidaceae bacterium]